MCRLCVRKGPPGAAEYVEDTAAPAVDKSQWSGVAVYADHEEGVLHPVIFELIGKARELAAVIRQPVASGLIGHQDIGPVGHAYPLKILLAAVMSAIVVCVTIYTALSHLLSI